jgi:translation initiation factor IF-1
MSGSGRKSQYRKSVTDSFLNDNFVPSETEKIVRVLGNRGDNTFEVQLSAEGKALARLPNKFNKLIWIKTGDYIVIGGEDEPADAATAPTPTEGKEQYAIIHILSKPNIKFLKAKNLWPEDIGEEGKGVAAASSRTDDLMPDDAGEEEEGGYYDDEEEEVLVDKMGNTIEK